jgi:hypothetical protein
VGSAAYGFGSLYLHANGGAALWLSPAVCLAAYRIITFKRDWPETQQIYFCWRCAAPSGDDSASLRFRRTSFPAKAWALRVLSVIFGIAFWAGPALQPWEKVRDVKEESIIA